MDFKKIINGLFPHKTHRASTNCCKADEFYSEKVAEQWFPKGSSTVQMSP